MNVEPEDIETVTEHFRGKGGLDHLRVRKWGKSIVIYCDDGPTPDNRARVTLIGVETWGLSFALHTGRWEQTPFVGDLDEVLDTLTSNFGAYLEKW